jgi:phage terminase large subunit GpA-like protein
VFNNLVLGKTWKTSINRLSAGVLAGRVEPIGLERIPPEIVLPTSRTTALRFACLGWPLAGAPAVLGHVIIDGNTLEDATWAAFDEFLHSRWLHPNGWSMKVDAAAIDSGRHEGRTQKVYDFCGSRLYRRVYAIRGVGGAWATWTRAARIKSGKMARLTTRSRRLIGTGDGTTRDYLDLISVKVANAPEMPASKNRIARTRHRPGYARRHRSNTEGLDSSQLS